MILHNDGYLGQDTVDFSKNLHPYAKMNAEFESAISFLWTQWEVCKIDEYNDVIIVIEAIKGRT